MSETRLQQAFQTALDLPPDTDWQSLAYAQHEHWDSLGHMALVAEIEEAFDIMMDTDDVIAMSSYPVAVEMLRTRYDVDL
ncbi:MAG TPA: acyl carrier protein [Capillimicrobium sp.]|jgi:acyl carrier protein|nr:acyl carrier protein [Capillimicrobium sp.]